MPAYSGIRPKLSGPGMPAADFLVQGPEAHGIPGLVNLFGIESPGLTSCLTLAETVLERLEDVRPGLCSAQPEAEDFDVKGLRGFARYGTHMECVWNPYGSVK